MKVLLDGWKLSKTQDIGGVESYWLQLVPELLRLGTPKFRFTILSAFLSPKRASTIDQYREMGAHIRHWWSKPQWLQLLGKLGAPADWLAGEHQLIHACEPDWIIPSRATTVITCHDLMFHHHPQFVSPDCAERLNRGSQHAVKHADYWLCNSEHTRADLIATFGIAPARTKVTPLGVGEDFFNCQLEEDSEEPFFLFVGSLEPKKNLPMLIEAFLNAKDKGLEAKLKVIGRASWQSKELNQLLMGHPELDQAVEFLGFVPHNELPGLMARSRGLVLPSRYEGFGLPVAEAMAANCPVMCTSSGALTETGGNAASFFELDNVEQLTELLLLVDSDRGIRDNMRELGRKHAAKYTWENCAQLSLEGYEQALKLRK